MTFAGREPWNKYFHFQSCQDRKHERYSDERGVLELLYHFSLRCTNRLERLKACCTGNHFQAIEA